MAQNNLIHMGLPPAVSNEMFRRGISCARVISCEQDFPAWASGSAINDVASSVTVVRYRAHARTVSACVRILIYVVCGGKLEITGPSYQTYFPDLSNAFRCTK